MLGYVSHCTVGAAGNSFGFERELAQVVGAGSVMHLDQVR